MIKNPISYPGNKNRLVEQIISVISQDHVCFVDVFCGSAVVGANSGAKTIVLNDSNAYILEILKYQHENSFQTIVNDVERVIDSYGLTYSRKRPKGYYVEKRHEGLSLYNKDAFNKLKHDYNNDRDVRKLFVLLIYGFNHYLRFNSKGEFNVPVGKVDFSNSIYDCLEEFENAFNKLKIIFSNSDFLNEELYSRKDALYYFDPPYLITNAPYNIGWKESDEIHLLDLLDKLNSNGQKFALSNVILSNGKENKLLIEWAKKYQIHYLKRQYRNANYQKINITDTIEVLITNF